MPALGPLRRPVAYHSVLGLGLDPRVGHRVDLECFLDELGLHSWVATTCHNDSAFTMLDSRSRARLVVSSSTPFSWSCTVYFACSKGGGVLEDEPALCVYIHVHTHTHMRMYVILSLAHTHTHAYMRIRTYVHVSI